MSNTTRALARVAPCAAPVGPAVPPPDVPVRGVAAHGVPARRLPAGTGPRPHAPEAAVPSEDPSAPGRSGGSRKRAPSVPPGAPRRRDGQEGHEEPAGRTGGPAAGDGGHAPPRTAGTPRA